MATRAIVYFTKAQPYNRSAVPALAVAAILKGHDGYPESPGMGANLFTLLSGRTLDQAYIAETMLDLANEVTLKLDAGREGGVQRKYDVEGWHPAPFAEARKAGADYIYVVSPARTDTTKLHLKVYEVGAKIERIYSGRLDGFLGKINLRKYAEQDRVVA